MEPNAPRRFTDEETAIILERASRMAVDDGMPESSALEPRAAIESTGLTFADLQAVGIEAGIPADAIARAASSVMRGEHQPALQSRSWGFPVAVEKTVPLDRAPTDAEWERMVVAFRRTFSARGHIRVDGSLREWSNGNLRANIEPTATGYQLRLSTRRGDAGAFAAAGGMAIAAVAVIGAIAAVQGVATAGMQLGLPFLGVMGLGAILRNALVLPRWAKDRSAQMQSLASEIAATSAVPPQP